LSLIITGINLLQLLFKILNSRSQLGQQLTNEKIKSLNRVLGLTAFVACLIMFFETEIRSIGHLESDPVGAIALLPTFYLSDLGMILPILLVFLSPEMKKLPSPGKRVSSLLIFSFFYGIAIWLIKNNPLLGIGGDVRVFLALFSGWCLVALLPDKHKALATTITVASSAALFIGAVILFALPDTDLMTYFQRTTHPAAFSILGLPLAFVGPSIVYVSLLGDRKLTMLSWVNAGIFIIIAVLIVQTRSLALSFLIGILFALITIFVLSIQSKHSTEKGIRVKIPRTGVILCIVFVTATLYWWSGHSDDFLTRLMGLSEYDADPAIFLRLLEIPTIFESMNINDHIFGAGLNPLPILIDREGTPHNASHVGILNVWWRLGFPIFLIMVSMFALLMARWVKRLACLSFQLSKNKVSAETLGLMVCWPGIATIFLISCMSGGWSPAATLPLGVLWGIYRKFYRVRESVGLKPARSPGLFRCLRIGSHAGQRQYS
jgi:hypothetical protein